MKTLIKLIVKGYAQNYWIELFNSGLISRDEMLERLDELDEEYRASKPKK